MLEGLADVAGDLPALLAEYATTLAVAQRELASQVGDARRARLDNAIAQAADDASERFDALRSGRRMPASSLVDDAQAWLVHPSGVEDPEAADRSRLQGVLARLQGEPRLEALDDRLRAASDWPGLRRLGELRDPSTDHSWMN